ncbi:MAG: hypothetical protein HY907_16135 [Deltaproteobacteria bacterium]|nr:hypothetical protein [Deltaproteobacteria bacterium]
MSSGLGRIVFWVGILGLAAAGCLERAKPELRSGAGPWGGATIVSHVSRLPGNPGSAYRAEPERSGHVLPPELGGRQGEETTTVAAVPAPANPESDGGPDGEGECACDASAACDYECACDPECPCTCDQAWSCEEGCACDPECVGGYGDCVEDRACNARCPGDPDCGSETQAPVEECACDLTWACDYECPCDTQCPCTCDLAWSCEADCGCDPECLEEYGDCGADETCNARCPQDPDCGGTPQVPLVAGTGDLEEYRQRCVEGINRYRATLGLPPLGRWTDAEACTDGEARSDSETGTAHGSFGACRERAQNACPAYPTLESTVVLCLQQMWDEGPGEPFSEHGHFLNMSSTEFREVACGFFEMPNGEIWAVQDFR